MTRSTSILVLLMLALAGCGHQTQPRPPEDVVPRAIESLSLTATPHGPRLQWMRPTTAVDGERLRDLAGFEIWRASGSDEGKFERIAVLVVDDRERFQQAKSFQYVDNHASSGHGYRYFVVAVSTDEYVSAPSNIVATEAEARGEAGNP